MNAQANTQTEENTMEQVKIGKKFSIAGLGFDEDALTEIVEENPKPTPILNVFAMVTSTKIETSRLDPTKTNTRFLGQFEAVNLMTGEEGRYAEAFFPGVGESYLTGLKDGAEGAITVAFTITVEADKSKNSAKGYKFGLVALVNKSKDADPFKAMRGLLPKVKAVEAKALPAGKKK